jgi:hypothetical protein
MINSLLVEGDLLSDLTVFPEDSLVKLGQCKFPFKWSEMMVPGQESDRYEAS